MITPRRTRLVRVPDLRAFRRAVALLSSTTPQDLFRSTAVVVPTRGAAHQLARTLGGPERVALPAEKVALLTREELYANLNARLSEPRRILTSCEREVMLHSAADEAIASGQAPPFDVRPGLVAEMMRVNHQLRRQGQTVQRFEELIGERLQGDEDRGAVRLLEQTRFLASSFHVYERRLKATDAVDEHALRDHLIAIVPAAPLTDVVITVGDWIGDPHGLAAVDFDLLTRLSGLERIDLVVTEGLLRSGFHQRIHDWLPGLEEIDASTLGTQPSPPPRELVVPVSRDREEELVSVARRMKAEGADAIDLDRVAVVFNRPLPYLYLGREVFGGARVPYQTIDALPLAAEQITAALDLVIEFVSSQFTRDATVALLLSSFTSRFRGDEPITRDTLAGLDESMHKAHYMGEFDRLRELNFRNAALPQAIAVAEELQPLLDKASASAHVNRLLTFLTSHANDEGDERAKRGRAALVDVLQRLGSAYAAHGDRDATIDDLAPDIRRWIEESTFVPESADHGLHLLDAQAARFGDFDDITLVGLVEGEWPERTRRNIFYAPSILSTLGWPPEKDRRSAATASFLDLVTSASRHVSISTFTLDDEALVEPSILIDEVAGLALTRVETAVPALELSSPEEEAPEWFAMRAKRTDVHDARFHGQAGPQAPKAISVSAVETYLACPFKYFAQYVLRLEEEREDEEVMDPGRRRAQFVHEVFESFFETWQSRGHRGITPDNLRSWPAPFSRWTSSKHRSRGCRNAEAARSSARGCWDRRWLPGLAKWCSAWRPSGRQRWSSASSKTGSAVTSSSTGPRGPRRIAIKGVTDRIDLLEDGTFRLIDYKLSSAPSKSRALQLPIYGLCAEQRLKGHNGRDWTLGEAAAIAFRGAKKVTPLFTARSNRAEVLSDAQEKLIDAVERIERGEFPPTPEDVFLCGFCSFAAVCRKDYVGDV